MIFLVEKFSSEVRAILDELGMFSDKKTKILDLKSETIKNIDLFCDALLNSKDSYVIEQLLAFADEDIELKKYKDQLLRTYLKFKYPRLTASDLAAEALFEAAKEGYQYLPAKGIKFNDEFLQTYLSAVEKFKTENLSILHTLFAYLVKNYPKHLNDQQVVYILQHPEYFNEASGHEEIFKLNAYIALCNTNNHSSYGMDNATGYKRFAEMASDGSVFDVDVSPDSTEFENALGKALGLMSARELKTWLNKFRSNGDKIRAVDYLKRQDPSVTNIELFRKTFNLLLSKLELKLAQKIEALLKKIEEDKTFKNIFKFSVDEEGTLDDFFNSFIKFVTDTYLTTDEPEDTSTDDTSTTSTTPVRTEKPKIEPKQEEGGDTGFTILKQRYNRAQLQERDLKKYLDGVAKLNGYDPSIVTGIMKDQRKFNELRKLLARPIKVDLNIKNSGLRELNELLRKFLFKYRP